MVEAEVICAGVAYFLNTAVLDATGTVRKDKRGDEIHIDVRHSAKFGEIIELSEDEFARLAEVDAVQEPGSAPLPGTGSPVATPFGHMVVGGEQVVYKDEDQLANEEAHRNGLTQEEVAEFERRASGEDDSENDDVEFTNVEDSTIEAIAAHIDHGGEDGKALNVDQTLALAMGDDDEFSSDLALKVYEAEKMANTTPRKGVVEVLEEVASND